MSQLHSRRSDQDRTRHSDRGTSTGAGGELWITARPRAAVRDIEQGRTVAPRSGSLTRPAAVLGAGGRELQGWASEPGRGRPVVGRGRRDGPAKSRPDGLVLGVLGPMEAWRDGDWIPLGPVRQRAVLALLVLHHPAGQVTEQLRAPAARHPLNERVPQPAGRAADAFVLDNAAMLITSARCCRAAHCRVTRPHPVTQLFTTRRRRHLRLQTVSARASAPR